MSAEEFPKALKKVLVHEGGYVDHPKDPGGATNKGVTFRVYNGYRKRKGLPQSRRVNDVKAVGQAWASGSVGPEVTWTKDGAAKALLEDRKTVPLKASVAALGGSGGATAVISQVTDQLTPIAAQLPSVGTVIAVLTGVGSAIAIGSLLYTRWAAAKEKDLDDALDANPVGVPA